MGGVAADEYPPAPEAIGDETPLGLFLERTQWIIEVDEFAAAPGHYEGLTELPSWLPAIDRLWLIVPLAVYGYVAWFSAHTIDAVAQAFATASGLTLLFFLLISSFQTLALGIIGEYVGKTYFEVKARPRYIIEKEVTS